MNRKENQIIMELYPLKLKAALKDYIWGGTRLRDEYGKASDLDKVAESWEMSVHPDGPSVIMNGPAAGKTLADYLTAVGQELPPILIKLIDAHDNLSVQVHPDNEYAQRVEGEPGKTEMWYIVEATPDAQLIYGFKQEITREEFAQSIKDNTLLDKVRQVPVKKGDVFYIPSGTLHAIGKGCLICEIQQSSNTTYRVYDYGRLGKDGKPRQLHVAKALDVTKLQPLALHTAPEAEIAGVLAGVELSLLKQSPYFTVYRLDLHDFVGQDEGRLDLMVSPASFQALTVLAGELRLQAAGQELRLVKGESAYLPAGLGLCHLSGKASVLLSQKGSGNADA
jgi:mannose-6-phosphate isomerase